MNGIIASKLNQINSLKNAMRYSTGLLLAKGKKLCTELAQVLGKKHDTLWRDLERIARNPQQVEAELLSNVIEKNKQKQGCLLIDNSVLVKEFARQMEGISRQHCGSQQKPGIGITAFAWTDYKIVEPITVNMWKKGDKSKVVTATDIALSLAQRINVKAVLADGLFASRETIKKYLEAHVYFVMRFPSNRVVSVPGFEGAVSLKNHVAFKFKKNQRCIVREVVWHGLIFHVTALKIKHAKKGWFTLFLVTNMPFEQARQAAGFYHHRWKIEVFFRTCKQRFGLDQCQARSLNQQKAHCLSVFLAYSRLQNSLNRKTNLLFKSEYPDLFTVFMADA